MYAVDFQRVHMQGAAIGERAHVAVLGVPQRISQGPCEIWQAHRRLIQCTVQLRGAAAVCAQDPAEKKDSSSLKLPLTHVSPIRSI